MALKQGKSAIVIPLPWDFMPADICKYLLDHNISGKTKVEVFEHLTWPEEKRHTMTIADCHQKFSDVSLMVISA